MRWILHIILVSFFSGELFANQLYIQSSQVSVGSQHYSKSVTFSFKGLNFTMRPPSALHKLPIFDRQVRIDEGHWLVLGWGSRNRSSLTTVAWIIKKTPKEFIVVDEIQWTTPKSQSGLLVEDGVGTDLWIGLELPKKVAEPAGSDDPLYFFRHMRGRANDSLEFVKKMKSRPFRASQLKLRYNPPFYFRNPLSSENRKWLVATVTGFQFRN